MIVPQAFSAGRETRQSAGQWPTSSYPSDTEKHTEPDFNDISKPAWGAF
jgi:hypothetical protein